MKRLFFKFVLYLWIISILLVGCDNQQNTDNAAINTQYFQELDSLKKQIDTLKVKINEMEENQNLVAIGEEPLKDMHFENGKCCITVFFKKSTNSVFTFDILLTDTNDNTKIIIPMLQGKAIADGREYNLEFDANYDEFRQLIIRAYEINTGKMWQKDWVNSSDI